MPLLFFFHLAVSNLPVQLEKAKIFTYEEFIQSLENIFRIDLVKKYTIQLFDDYFNDYVDLDEVYFGTIKNRLFSLASVTQKLSINISFKVIRNIVDSYKKTCCGREESDSSNHDDDGKAGGDKSEKGVWRDTYGIMVEEIIGINGRWFCLDQGWIPNDGFDWTRVDAGD
ncbi:unnamed protein product [Didymodactylos carnosus]|uniref:Uncharacterized protein n=1 Tax=Didymodactylos carnosus TaxID=1234261 RepID=A0A815JEM2_9BILA|nr:unnamed protein product [Didymodactylos carnosus]CAF4276281.1 unnamed protein product [Didymodactylos carnosus]